MALGKLLVVHHQHCAEEKGRPEKEPQKGQGAKENGQLRKVHPLQIEDEIPPPLVAGAQKSRHLVLPQGDGESAAEGDQGHGPEETDVGQSRSVLPHSVEHPGEGDEVPGLVVKVPVPLQRLQQIDAAEDEHPVGPQSHQQGGRREGQEDVPAPHQEGVKVGADGDVISAP